MAEPGDPYPPLQPDSNPVPTLPEPGDTITGGGIKQQVNTGHVKVTFTYQLHSKKRYPGDEFEATGIARFLPSWPQLCKAGHYVQSRIGGDRPMRLVISMNGNVVYQGDIQTRKSCMKIYYRLEDLPCYLDILLSNHSGCDTRREHITE